MQSENIKVAINPDVGGSILSLQLRHPDQEFDSTWVDILPPSKSPLKSSSNAASFLMLPYSNRIRDGNFTFRGKFYSLNNGAKHAIHGDVRNRPWQVVSSTPQSLKLSFNSADFSDWNFPFPISATQEFILDEYSFKQRVIVTNCGTAVLPVGGGFHPYFRSRLGGLGTAVPESDLCSVSFKAMGYYPYQGSVPLSTEAEYPLSSALDYSVARPLAVGLDHCFSGWDGEAILSWTQPDITLRLTANIRSPREPYPHLIVYTPSADNPLDSDLSGQVFAIEPVTHRIDCFNLHAKGLKNTGMIELNPGEHLYFDWGLEIVRE